MEAFKILTSTRQATSATTTKKRHKTDGVATAALLIQIAGEMLETSPTLRKRLGVTLSDLIAADKVRKELTRRALTA